MPIAPVVLSAVFATAALAQSSSIAGTVLGTGGYPVSGAPVQAKNLATQQNFRTLSSATGAYSLANLPAGTYELSVKMPGFQYLPFVNPEVKLAAAQNLSLDVKLPEGNLGTIGDDPFSYLSSVRAKSAKLNGPVPRTADGKPDLSGVWNANHDLYPEDPALLPWAAAIFKQRLENEFKDAPSGLCLPASVLMLGPFFKKFVQTPNLLIILNEDDVIGFRQVYLDGRGHPKDWNPTWMGHAIGRWDGDTLVVDVTGFNTESWLDSYPHTEQLHVIERYRRVDFGHMEVQFVAEDPGTLSKPWTLNMVWDLAADEDILENVCTENNKDTVHLVGK